MQTFKFEKKYLRCRVSVVFSQLAAKQQQTGSTEMLSEFAVVAKS